MTNTARIPGIEGLSGPIGIPAGNRLVGGAGGIVAPGRIIQVRHVRSTPTRYAIAAQELVPIPELEIIFRPHRANSLLRLVAMINGTFNYVGSSGFLRDGVPVVQGGLGNNNASGPIVTIFDAAAVDAGNMHNVKVEHVEAANGTRPIQYQAAHASSWAGTVYTSYINDRAANDMRSVSSMTIWEIAQ